MKEPYKNFKGGLEIREEFSKFIPPMSKEAFKLLTENIKNDGYIRDPLVVWGDIILDGHHRYKIAESLDITFKVKKETFKSDNDAKLWMLNNQIGSRRMSTSQLAVFALAYIPIYTELCKERQKQGGKDKIYMGKGLKTTELAAKKVGVNAKIVVNAKYLNDNFPEIIPLIRAADYEGLTVDEAKELKRQHDTWTIKVIVADGKLTEEAETMLKEIREPKKTEEKLKAGREFFFSTSFHKEMTYSVNDLQSFHLTKAGCLYALEDFCHDDKFRDEAHKIITRAEEEKQLELNNKIL